MILFSLTLLLLVPCGLPLLIKGQQTNLHVLQIITDYPKLSRLSGNEKTHCPGLPTGQSRWSMCDLATPLAACGIMTY